MDLRYLRFSAFGSLKEPFAERARSQRMAAFEEHMRLRPGMRVLDLGGQASIWDTVKTPLDITILNLPGIAVQDVSSHHKLLFVEGDGCNVNYDDKSFDIVFSNSVIEHVGPVQRQVAFASEVQRLGKAYWLQTPAIWFPIEAHCGMPFWFFYPDPVRQAFIRRWREKLPAWTEMVEGTRVLRLETLRELFPGARLHIERVAGIPKSYSMYSPGAVGQA